MKKKIKHFTRKIKYNVLNPFLFRHIKLGVKCSVKWYGNSYGGFYLIPNLLKKDSIIYSFGIGEDISFDKDIIDVHHCHVYGFDPTPKSIDWCKKNKLPKKFHFNDFGISDKTGMMKFHLPKNKNHVSGSLIHQQHVSVDNTVEVKMKSFGDILSHFNHNKLAVLKMDIEGSEYNVIEGVLNANIQIDQIAIELHERFFDNGKEKSIQLITTLNNHGYEVSGISPLYEEISFVRKEALSEVL